MTAKTDELKPCPFCGGKASFERQGTHRQSCIVVCDSCGCRHESGYEYELSAHGWNARAALQSQDREDAERYRWLRHCKDEELENILNAFGVLPDGQDLDKAIDHARRIEGEGE